MVITLEPEIEATLNELARQQGIPPEVLVANALRERFHAPSRPVQPQDEWEQGLLDSARDWGVSFSDAALSSEGLYE